MDDCIRVQNLDWVEKALGKGQDLVLIFVYCNVIINECLQTYARVLSALGALDEDSPV